MASRHLWVLFTIAHAASACTGGDQDGSVCVSSGIEDVEEVEDVSDADVTIHLQTRAFVDPRLGQELHGLSQSKDGRSWKPKAVETSEHPVQAQAQKSVREQRSASDDSAVEMLTLTEFWARSLPFLQVAIILSIIIVLFGVHKLAKNAGRAEVDKAEVQFDASAKLQQLLRGMRFEPSDSPLSTEMQPKKKAEEMQPARPVKAKVKESDSGNNAALYMVSDSSTESEPEAEEEELEAESAADTAVCAIAKFAKQIAADSPQKPVAQSPWNDKVGEVDFKGRFTVQVVSC